jgi:hypothetical protein
MSIKVHIADPASGLSASIDNSDSAEENGLIVATRPLKVNIPNVLPFINPTYGIDMNQDGSSGGIPIKIHDGTDSVLWTRSSIVRSEFTFDSTDQNHTAAGSKSVRFAAPNVGDIAQFDSGGLFSLTGYVSITMWIYVSASWAVGDQIEIYGYDTVANSIVGNSVALSQYFDWSIFGTWHKITISLEDLGLQDQTIDVIRIENVAKQSVPPIFYIDDIQIEETGDPIVFTLEPNKGVWYYVRNIRYLFADAYDSTLASSSMPKIPYDSILGVSQLDTGILYALTKDGITRGFPVRQFLDFMQIPDMKVVSVGGDGTNTWMVLETESTTPIILKSENGDKITITISDDLSGFLQFRAFVFVDVEERIPGSFIP